MKGPFRFCWLVQTFALSSCLSHFRGFTCTNFVTLWYTCGSVSSYLEGCNFLTVTISTHTKKFSTFFIFVMGS
ncbi:hypothetical protein Patl1_26301 [Pistacia atlantica]|uniref:Uncharacterized protein n=1 Tax=Pistacia atlantica TaxID=434234 RepID=A0ACC1AZB3_9ROSI|nr:hypothetical protein Patl1_26301 [Pistacia atlantica]